MTTGPFNISGHLTYQAGHSYRVWREGDPVPPQSWSYESVIGKHRRYVRPVSITSPISVSNWREPTNWSSSGDLSATRATGMFYVKIVDWFAPYWGIRNRYQDYTVTDGYGAPPVNETWPPYDSAKYRDVTITKCLLKLKNQRVDLSTAFGERKEASRMFERFSRAAVTGLLGFKQNVRGTKLVYSNPALHRWARRPSGKFSAVKHLLVKELPSEIHNHWLEYVYGLAPFMQDLYGSMESLAYLETDLNAYRVTVKSSHKEVDKVESYLDYLASLGSSSSFTGGFNQVTTVTSTTHTSLTYVLENPFLRSLAQLGVTNPAVTAWELTRLSFVFDWVLPIGNYLSTFDATFGWRWLGGTTSVLRKARGEFFPVTKGSYYERSGASSTYTVSRIGEKPSYSAHSFTREKFLASPLPQVPRLKNPLSGAHVVNALALLRGAFS